MHVLQRAVPVLLPSGANTSVHRFLVSGPVRDARTEHPCVQTSARHNTVSVENNMYTRSLEEA